MLSIKFIIVLLLGNKDTQNLRTYDTFINGSFSLSSHNIWGCFGFDIKLNRNVSMPGVAMVARKSQHASRNWRK